jgi:ABC-type lipoprotein export system ATPase subunit
MPETWFKDIQIPLNPGLVAVIGNKGSGKSALTDIMALCADTTNQNWSFLTPSKFRLPKPYNRSKQTEASIQWFDDSHSAIKTLDMSSDLTQPERVKYIPQNFLETLCTTENDQEFEGELKKIIFQYLEPSQRYGFNDLDSIITYLAKENYASCSEIQGRIKNVNADIIEKEAMLAPDYKSKLENELKYKQEQLSNIQSAKPEEVIKPSTKDDPDAKKAKEEIAKLQEDSKKLISSLQKLHDEREVITKSIQDIKASKERLDRLSSEVNTVKNELECLYSENKLNIESVLNFSYHPEILDSKVAELTMQLNDITNQLNENSQDSLRHQYNSTLKELEEAKKKLSAPELAYQKYIKEKQEWEKILEELIGSQEKDGTIKNIQYRIDYINHRLEGELSNKKQLRRQFVEELMQKKQQVLDIYNSLFAPIVKFTQDYREDLKDYPINFDSTFAIKNFEEKFFDYISQQSAGSYYGKEQGLSRIKDHIDSINMSDIQSIVEFACTINDDLLHDRREDQSIARIVEAQLKKGHSKQEVYDFLYGMDYVSPFFQIKMNGKPLSSLSPGERGALLLLLYLFIDMDDKPLIIDQPEENLDNESVYKYLVHFIKTAKKKRQLIMVTHNPNLAVVCDADQIIQMKIDKLNGNKVSYESGAIENPTINKIIVDILEGTYPAFHNRDSKYFDKTI